MIQKWKNALAVYFDWRMLTMIGLGFSSGFPFLLVSGTLALWLTDSGIGLEMIGFFSLVKTPYSFKWLWSPLVDRFNIPLFSKLGRRRGWAVFSQILLLLSLLALASVEPAQSVYLLMFLALLTVFASATQDIVLDAYRVESFDNRDQAAGTAMFILGYRIGSVFSGAVALLLATILTWNEVYVCMALGAVLGMVTILCSREPQKSKEQKLKFEGSFIQRLKNFYQTAVKSPIADFITRPSWFVVLLFIMLYKLCDAYMVPMTMPFYDAMGFTKGQIAFVTKFYGMAATIIGGILGGVIVNRFGIVKSLYLGSVLQGLTTLMYVWQAHAGNDLYLLMGTVSLDNLAGGMSTTAFVAYISSLCNTAYTATQYALLSSFMSLARDLLASTSGALVKVTGWSMFFVITTLMALPGLLILFYLQKKLKNKKA